MGGTWLRDLSLSKTRLTNWGSVQKVISLADLGPTLPALARLAIEHFLREDTELSLELSQVPAAPVFVSLHTKELGHLRGCMGTLVAREADVRLETRRCAVMAAIDDPRFHPLALTELASVTIDVTILCPLEPVRGLEFLDPKRYGVIATDNWGHRGVLLPDLDGIDDVQTQLDVVRRKAGIAPSAAIDLQRFEALRFCEH